MVKKVTTLNVLEPFLQTEEHLHLAQASRLLNKPHPTVRKQLKKLESQGILKKRSKGRLSIYALNKEHPNLIDYAAVAEKTRLIRKCNEEPRLKELTNALHKLLHEQNTAVIFGSATASLSKAHDVDILTTGKVSEEKLKSAAERLNIKLHLVCVPNLKAVSESLRKEILKKHLIIQGSEQLLGWLLS